MLLAPLLVLYGFAKAGAFVQVSPPAYYALLVAAWVPGIVALLASGWRRDVQLSVGGIYIFAAILLTPLLTLAAGCAAGDCI